MKNLIALTLLLGGSTLLCAQKPAKTPATYKPVKSEMYRKGWIDFNKNGVKDVYEDPSAPLEARIENLLQQMTLDEKTCQMVTLYGYKRVLKDDLPTPEWKELLWKDGIGAIDEHLNGFQQWGLPPSDNAYVWPASRHAWALNEVQRFFVEDTRLGIPVDFTNEGIRGVESYRATNFPTQLGLGHTWNRELIRQVGLITGREARMLGYTNVYAPILDVGRDQRWGRYEEVYGESPYLVAELGIEMVRGLQHNHQVAATGKHFAAYSNNKGAREGMARVDPQMSPREVENIHIYPFKRVIREAGMLGVMSSYNDYDGIPVQGSYYWLTTRLRGEMGFRGYVVSDSDAVEYLYTKHGTAKDMKEAVRQSVEAGLNVRCTFRSPDSFVLPLRELVKEGGLSEEVINDRVRDILRVKFLIGLFDAPYQTDLAGADREVEKEENEAIALQASHESVVLLKNADELLPLDINSTKKIAVCGPNANEEGYALTHYGPLAVEVTTVLEGIQEKTKSKAEVLYTKGCDLVDAHWPESEIIDYPLTDDEQAEIDKAVENARQADVAVVVLGGGQRTCGENKSRTSLDLPGRQLQLLQAIQATGKPVVLILINGRPLSINWADKFVPAILEAWYPGSKGGTALADILFGDYNPGGKLTVTFPKTVGQIPFNFPCKPSSQIDGGKNPGPTGNMSRINGALYPFGYGLSYTTFEYSDLKADEKGVTLTVTNTLTDVSARKVWTSLDNQFTLNPANLPDITLTLKQTTAETATDGDKIIATVTLGWDAEAGKVVAKNLDGWQFGEVVEYTAPEGSKNIWWGYKWYNLPAYDAEGNIYRYYAKEQTPVGSGWQLVTDDPNATNTAPIPANSENRVFQITNTPITYTLPETGGIGTLPFTLGGLLLMAAAALLLGQEIKRRREGC